MLIFVCLFFSLFYFVYLFALHCDVWNWIDEVEIRKVELNLSLTMLLTHLPLVPHICVGKLGQHLFR